MKKVQARILIVDDIQGNRDMLKRRLQRHDYEVATADGGKQALAMLADEYFDLVLLDIMMPDLSGTDMLRQLRANSRWQHLPVIMVTAKDEGDALPECLKLGANDYVSKPINMPVLIARITSQLSRKWAMDAVLQTQTRLEITVDERTRELQQMMKDLQRGVVKREQAQMEATLAKTRLLDAIEALGDGFALFDAEQRLQVVNRKFHELYGLSPSQVAVGTPYEVILRRVVEKGVISEADGREEEWIREQLEMVENESEQFIAGERWLRVDQRKTSEGGLVGLYSDITEHKHIEQALRDSAARDPLTGLYNRREFMTVMASEIDRWERYQTQLSVMLLDIDFFKQVNDSYGHAVGDMALCAIATLLQGKLRTSDMLARWGGEEFIIMLPNTELDHACLLAERIRKIISGTPIAIKGEEKEQLHINITVSIGVAVMTKEHVNTETLIAEADHGLYRAKESGRNRVSP